MFKYLLAGLAICSNIKYGHAADVDMLPASRGSVAALQPTAKQICGDIIAATPLVELPPASLPESSIKRWGRESVMASLYQYNVDMLKTIDRARDMNQAKAWYATAALLGKPHALYSLAIIFIKKDKQELLGRILMQAAADKNDYDARVYLGLEKEDY